MKVELITVNEDYGFPEFVRNIRTATRVTDFAYLLGCIKYSHSLEEGAYWVIEKTLDKAYALYPWGDLKEVDYTDLQVGVRPVLPLSAIKDISFLNSYRRSDGILEVEYGYYPQDVPDSIQIQNELELTYIHDRKRLLSTKNSYAIYSRKDKKISPIILPEYQYGDRRYVRVAYTFYEKGKDVKIADKQFYNNKEIVWFEVKPVKWFVDEKENLLISKKILFAGVPYHFDGTKTISFNESTMSYFLNNYFIKELVHFCQPDYQEHIKQILTNYDCFLAEVKKMTTSEKKEFLKPFLALEEEQRKTFSNLFRIVDDELFELYNQQENNPKTKKKKRFFR